MIKVIKKLEETSYGNFFTVERFLVELPNGKQTEFYLRDSTPFAIIIPILENGNFIMVKQYRFGSEKVSLEFPMGMVFGKTGEEAAPIELREETGYAAGKLEKIGEVFLSPGWSKQTGTIYIGTELKPGKQELEEFEFLEVVNIPPSDFPRLIGDGTIFDAATIVAYTHYLQHLGKLA